MKTDKALQTNKQFLDELENLEHSFPALSSISDLDLYASWIWLSFLPNGDSEEFLQEITASTSAEQLQQIVYQWRETGITLSDPLARESLLGLSKGEARKESISDQEGQAISEALHWTIEQVNGREVVPEDFSQKILQASQAMPSEISLKDLVRLIDIESQAKEFYKEALEEMGGRERLARHLIAIRSDLGWSQAELAQTLETNSDTISRLERAE